MDRILRRRAADAAAYEREKLGAHMWVPSADEAARALRAGKTLREALLLALATPPAAAKPSTK